MMEPTTEKKSRFSWVRQSFSAVLALMLLCGLVFPVILSGLAACLFPKQAAGSLVMADGEAVGAATVGQEFLQPCFMKGRPSAYHYNVYTVDEQGNRLYRDGSPYPGLSSGSTNYAPTNPALAARVAADVEAFLAANPGVRRQEIPADLMTASGSGLDPHISPEAADIQVPALAQASGISEEALRQIIQDNTQGKLLGIFGEETVNVLGVNLAIAQQMGKITQVEP